MPATISKSRPLDLQLSGNLQSHTFHIDYLTWFRRVVGWDAVFPFVIATVAAGIGLVFGRGPGIDVLALVPLPVLAFLFRLGVGLYQINTNACGRVMRALQIGVLACGLLVVMFLDFFVALGAFNPNNGVDAAEIGITFAVGSFLSLSAATFAMFPGRVLDNRKLPREEAAA